MKALITGSSGFVGPYLRDRLIRNGYGVIGLARSKSQYSEYAVDITDAKRVNQLIADISPDVIFHLASQSSVKSSWSDPELTMKINIEGTKNILESSIICKKRPFVIVISSSEVYGIPKQTPIRESDAANGISPYAKSKIEQEKICREYMDKLDIIISRSFSHTGPGQREDFVISDFAKQIAEIESGFKEPTINVGNVNVIRDFSDVRDVVRAYQLLFEKGSPGEVYNVCSGKGVSISESLNMLVNMANIKVNVTVDDTKLRRSDIPILVGDNNKLIKDTGWEPNIPFCKTLNDTLNYWRKKLSVV